MLRELTCEELGFVSGGLEIVVTGSSISGSVAISQFFDDVSAWNSIQNYSMNAVRDAEYGTGLSAQGDSWEGDHDNDGTPNYEDPDFEIVVNGNPSALNGYVLAPANLNGQSFYMYPIGPNGQADTTRPPVLTPEGQRFVCEAYAEWLAANNDASLQFGIIGSALTADGQAIPAAATGTVGTILGVAGRASTPPVGCEP